MTESQERFVRAILEQLPASRVVELHLFPALRQGATETGVAVIAARREGSAEGGAGAESGAVDASGASEATDRAPADFAAAPGGPPPEGQVTDADATDRHLAPAPRADSVQSDDSPPDEPDEPEPSPIAPRNRRGRIARPARRAAQEPGERHTVFTARYRLAVRGPDRGKWEFDLVEEADAPLVTVDAVVRGVQERAGEEGAPERLGPDALAALAAGPGAPWTTPAR